jgi:tripartite-type tricarboxylate transporter receptor subunit TctC
MAGLLIASGMMAASSSAAATDFYAGKQLTFIAATEPGGGYDIYVRTVARTLPKYIPGNPNTIVQNMPGAGGIRGANFLYNVAAKDGLTIGEIHNGLPFAQLYGNTQAQYDPEKFIWLGSPTKETSVFLLWHAVPVNSIAEAKKRELVLGAAGAATGGAFYSRILTAAFGLKIRTIVGYKGMGESLLAMERGENEGYASAFLSTLQSTRADWLKEGKIKLILRYSGDPIPGFEKVPLAEDLATKEEDRQLLQMVSAPFTLGRPFAAPPGIPDDRAALLKKAFTDTTRDADFRADCARQHLECDSPSTGDQLAEVIRRTYAAPDSVKKRLFKIYQSER